MHFSYLLDLFPMIEIKVGIFLDHARNLNALQTRLGSFHSRYAIVWQTSRLG